MSGRTLPDKATIREPDCVVSVQIAFHRPAPDSKADNKIAREKNVNVSGASAKNKVAVSAAVNQADDKTGSFETTKRREVTPASLLFTAKHRSKGVILLLCQKKKQ
jgi:hypothetical protein